jgi:tetratricopeptide (TPR) repeat protein
MFFSSCAYFNTFFNAKEYFDEAEKIRLEKEGERIPVSAIDKYGKSIKKSKKVISDFPESKYVNSAIILMAKSQFHRQEYDLAINNIKSILNSVENKQKEEAIYWIALCKWKKGNLQTAINELEDLISKSQINTIKSMAFLSLSEIFNELKDLNKSIDFLQEAGKLTNERSQKGIIYNKLAEMAFDKKDFKLALEGYEKVVSFSLSKKNNVN